MRIIIPLAHFVWQKYRSTTANEGEWEYLYIFLLFLQIYGNNFYDFLLVSMEDKVLLKVGLLLNERICSYGSKFFSLRTDHH